MAEPTHSEKLELKLKTLTFKRDYLFGKVQKLYDFSKTIKDDSRGINSFLAQFSELESVRTKFENTILDIFELDMQLKPGLKLTTSQLDAFDSLYEGCSLMARKYQGQLASSHSSSHQKSDSDLVRASLPKLTLFEFDGQLENWKTFYDTFISLVHNREFADIDKFHYLLSCVKGPALNIVKKLPITAANYPLVWQSLLEKYHDNRALVSRYLDKMLTFTPLQKDTTANLTLFVETFDHSLKAIQALKIKNLDDYLFCHLALRGLDTYTRKLFEESRDQNKIPTFSELIEFVNKQIKVLEHTFPSSSTSFQPNSKQVRNNNTRVNYNINKVASKSVLTTSRILNHKKGENNKNKFVCAHCEQDHMIYRCEHFRKMPVDDRIDRVKYLKLCSNCLKSDHDSSSCKSLITCGVCASLHHYLLHRDTGSARVAQPSLSHTQQTLVSSHSVSASVDAQAALCCAGGNQYGVVLGTTLAHVRDFSGEFQSCRAVIDSGAQSSFITNECAQRLGLPRAKCPFSIAGLGGEYVKNLGMINCTLKPRHADSPKFTINLVVVNKVASDMPNINFPDHVREEYKHFELADPFYFKRSRVDILLGNDVVSEIIKDKPMFIKTNIPSVIETVFGYVISGKLCPFNDKYLSQNLQLTVSFEKENTIDKILRTFWEIEEVPCSPALNPRDQLAEEIFTKEHTREASGRYVVPLLLAPDHSPLGESRTTAERRLLFTERKLARTPELQQAYNEFMREYENLDHMEVYTGTEASKYVIPHHSILRPTSTSTPLRVVFDASAKTNNNISLNDILLTGPKLYRDITAIILNFRLFEYCFVCDVCKMYRAIRLRKYDRCYQHILYRESLNDSMKIYELKTITYGLSSSPFLAIRTLLQLASDEEKSFPLAARVIQEGVYMDDILYSCNTYEEACTLQDQLVGIFNSGCFTLKKWTSNNADLLKRIPSENRECPVTFQKDGDECTIKVLGLTWTPGTDSFLFSITKTIDPVLTKRSVLKLLASIYDPVGFIAPSTFVAKQIMQDLWKLGLGWDERLPHEIGNRWATYIAELPCLADIRIERHMLLPEQKECELVGFCDASSRGYAACVYAVSRDAHGNVKARLVTAKSKVAPVKPMTIPRLELMSAVLLSKLLKFVCDNLTRVNIIHITCLTDSTIVLSWLHTEAYKLKTFVCNRVTQITEVVPSHHWRHVKSENNLADICSRGVYPSQLVADSARWLLGDQWLYQSRQDWPISTFIKENEAAPPELKPTYNNLLTEKVSDLIESKKEFCERVVSKFSSYSRLQRCIAWILRWRNKSLKGLQSTSLTTEELNKAQDTLIRLVQSTHFETELGLLSKNVNFIPSLKKLSPFLDSCGFLRVGGRIRYAELPYDAKHPRLLPKDSTFTKLIIEYYHKKYLHAGPRTLQSIISQSFWILAARSLIRSILSKCRDCFKCKPSLSQPEMAPLPPTRLKPNKVFEHVGVDLGGPFFTKESLRRNAKVTKSYLALFVCYSTKAVHLELLSSLSAESFLACLDRFVARRGLCSFLYSDCGTNFIASSRHLTEVQKFLRDKQAQNDIISGCAQRQIIWKFNVPSAPHMGGLWEAGIKSAKYHIIRSVGEKSLTFEELYTIFCKIEAILNSRPLCPLPASDDPHEFNVLTAGHFLIGKPLTAVPEYNLEEIPINRLSRWQYLQKSSQSFWKRWSREYLNTLQQRAKWFTSKNNPQVGDLVLIKTDNAPPCTWPLGKIEILHPGPDAIIRCATIRTQKRLMQRPVNKLCPLPYTN